MEYSINRFQSFMRDWLKDRYNLMALGIVLLSFLIRLYYFTLTSHQPLWWDEAEYLLKAKNIALGTPETGFWYGRPIYFSVFLSLFYYAGLGETAIRFTIILISTLSILFIYLLGKQLFDKKVALISSFLFSLVYVNLFYTVRVMTDVIHVFLGVLAFYLFFTKKRKLMWLVFPILALATMIRFPSFFFFVILAAYILLTEGFAAFKNKDYWISGFLGLLVALPYLIWSQLKFGAPLYAISLAGGGSLEGVSTSYGVSNTFQYILTFPSYLGWILLALFVLGLILTLEVFMGIDLVFREKNKRISRKFFLLLWLIIPLIYFGFGVSHYEDRYLFMAFPAIFFIIGLSLTSLKGHFKDNKKWINIAMIIIVLIGGFQLMSHSDQIIKSRLDSYGPVRDAGIWLNEHTLPGESIMSKSSPQLTYYSSRAVYTISSEEDEFAANLSVINPKYVVVSLFENHPPWALSLDQEKYGLEPVKSFPVGNQPSLVIYQKS